MNKITHYEDNIKICIEMFNSVVLDIKNAIKSDMPDDAELKLYYIAIEATIKYNEMTPILLFIQYIYANDTIRRKIIEKDEKFFENSSHDKLGLSEKNKKDIEMFFQFQKCWKDLSDESKEYIKDAMYTLVNTAKTYIKIKGKIDDIKKK
jgi:hypothetical protein